MMRRRGHALTGLARDLLDRPVALCQKVDDLGPPTTRERTSDRGKGVEESSLCMLISHTFKLSFECERVNVARPSKLVAIGDGLGSCNGRMLQRSWS